MHLYLIGYRGSGKSTVGRHLGRVLSMPYVDTDDRIEASYGMSIREIFESEGEAGFRDREEAVLTQVAADTTPAVVATGGGAILRENNRRVIATTGHCVWLNGSAKSLFQRIEADNSTNSRRPSLSSRGGYDEVVEVLAAREPLYRELAQSIVETDNKSADDVVDEVLSWLRTQSPK
jgi:shikimate kinase